MKSIRTRPHSVNLENKSTSDSEGWQDIASRHAAAFAFEVLATLDLEETIFRLDSNIDVRADTDKIWNVPHLRNPNFTGREGALKDLMTSLQYGQETAVVRASASIEAIHGLGGIGKTQVAVEYAYRHVEEYDIVWWVRAEEPATLTADLAVLAQELGLSEATDADQAVVVAAVHRWLERRERRWLLIFDNVNDASDLKACLPNNGGHVLITSRSRKWPRTDKRVEVDVLTPKEAIQFLLRRSGQDDELAAEVLAEELGYLPLALAQAGAYIDEVGLSLPGYLARFRTHREELLQRGKPDDYPLTVATTWELSFQSAAARVPAAGDLMNLFAFFAPEGIPRDLLATQAQVLPASLAATIANPVAMDGAIAALRHFSLLEVVNDETLTMHRIVQAAARHRLEDEALKNWCRTAIAVIHAAFPQKAHEWQNWSAASRLLPHGLRAVTLAEELGVAGAMAGELLNRVGRYLTGRALYAQSRETLERALQIRQAVLGPDHPDVGMDL